ncbi:MAG: hypothetical protein JAY75_18310 [Candidatus Thiodiazotropha taylori]|nr:hypothetical protein [Candidatus Thiodiazotropha taylori]
MDVHLQGEFHVSLPLYDQDLEVQLKKGAAIALGNSLSPSSALLIDMTDLSQPSDRLYQKMLQQCAVER